MQAAQRLLTGCSTIKRNRSRRMKSAHRLATTRQRYDGEPVIPYGLGCSMFGAEGRRSGVRAQRVEYRVRLLQIRRLL